MMDAAGMFGLRLDSSVTRQRVKAGTIRRILPYARRYRWALALFVVVCALDAVITVANPLLLRQIVDAGILPRKLSVVADLSAVI
ncbi:MAG TPA: ABC transporter ATP-binding protein, partial [Streptosporangiaceae bacterium]|nr:ABC transporter ATP-binding protein [Streptosporangiaceae bacterium]